MAMRLKKLSAQQVEELLENEFNKVMGELKTENLRNPRQRRRRKSSITLSHIFDSTDVCSAARQLPVMRTINAKARPEIIAEALV
mmetsp:Transcript_16287/g.18444  ORF Transcript_16287/g.18444 Transcript_16287/m.18444 type:complete len:85 (+) Transcript_16287:221-475(+)